MNKREKISGWGGYPRVACEVRRPRRRSDVFAQVDAHGTIARGLGRSYGDTAINSHGVTLDCTPLDRYLALDEERALLTCEAGASLGQIIDDLAPRGLFPKVTPGTKFVTVGGCIANDVHGKAHHVDGTFGQSVESMRVLLASGEIVDTSREREPALFWSTIGGVGLTGVILDATFALRRVETTYFHQHVEVAQDLDALLDAIDEADKRSPYSVAWVDSLARGKSLGRGVLTHGDHASLDSLPRALQKAPLRTTSPSPIALPFELPSGLLNTATVKVLNVALDQMQRRGAELAHYEKFFYPLDFIGDWHRGYGKRGFTQYQFVIPKEGARARLRAFLEKISGSGQAPFLNVLKRMGPENQAHLSFPMEGYTFAIDFPIRRGLARLLKELDAMVLEAGGRIYLGKDAFLDAATFAQMYPRVEEWRALKAKYDPHTHFTSELGRRVGLS